MTAAVSFAARAIASYEETTRLAEQGERESRAAGETAARKRITARFADELDVALNPSQVTLMEPDTKLVPAPEFDASVHDRPYAVVVDGATFVAYTEFGSWLYVVNHCSICKRDWLERCRWELASIGEALCTAHECPAPGEQPPKELPPVAPSPKRPLSAFPGGQDSDNIAVIAHNLGSIAHQLDQLDTRLSNFFDCGASMAGRGV